MSTQEEIEAAVELWKQFRERNTIDVFAVIHPDVVGVRWAMADKLADAYLTERQQRERDQQPPTREMFERLASRLGDAVQWHDDFEFPELCIAEHGSVFLTETRHLRAACLLLGIETDGIL